MTTEDRGNETRTLKGGEHLGLVRRPGEKWRITSFEHSMKVSAVESAEAVVASSGAVREVTGMLSWSDDMPEEWAEMRFDSVDDAVTFVESQLARSGSA